MSTVAIPADIKSVLLGLFTWANGCYKEMLTQGLKENETVGFSCDEPEVQKHYEKLKVFFLNGPIKKSALALAATEGSVKGTPPVTDEELFKRSLEHLLEWAARYLIVQHNQEEQFLNEFLNGFSNHPMKVVYAPIFRLDRPNGSIRINPIELSTYASLYEFTWVERDILKYEAGIVGRTNNFPPGFPDILPSLCVKIEYPMDKDDGKVIPDANKSINDLKTILTGLFDTDVEIPFFFIGIKYPWHCWVSTGGQASEEFPHEAGYKQFSDQNVRLFEKYWKDLSQSVLGNYHITVSRLQLARSRKSPLERTVDLSIALEGLFHFNDELSFRYSAITASIVETDPAKRVELYTRLKSFYSFRSKVVHGNTLDKKWAKLSKDQIDQELKIVEKAIRKFLKLQILNAHLRTQEGQTEHLLGVTSPIIHEMSL
jgi:hypothetical protein